MTTGYGLERDDYLKRLARIEGQVRGIAKMVEEDRYCIDVLTQIVSVTSALRSLGLGLVDQHIRTCVRAGFETDDELGDERITEATRSIERLLRA
ncbi:MAG: metal-sensitive transcriptional regulator [Acidimicrobiales bacterium]|nr:metal-sensitive transcriptional regulator [Acidimicrobiales bacterium]